MLADADAGAAVAVRKVITEGQQMRRLVKDGNRSPRLPSSRSRASHCLQETCSEGRRQFDPQDPQANRGIIYKLFSANFFQED